MGAGASSTSAEEASVWRHCASEFSSRCPQVRQFVNVIYSTWILQLTRHECLPRHMRNFFDPFTWPCTDGHLHAGQKFLGLIAGHAAAIPRGHADRHDSPSDAVCFGLRPRWESHPGGVGQVCHAWVYNKLIALIFFADLVFGFLNVGVYVHVMGLGMHNVCMNAHTYRVRYA